MIYTVADPEHLATVYAEWLGYQIVGSSVLSDRDAGELVAPSLAGRAQWTLAPASGEGATLRLIAEPRAERWRALSSFGWNVSEIVVSDVDALASRLRQSPFEIIGEPMSLTRFPMIRAMQVRGPAGEVLYFTEIGAGSGLDLAQADGFVGRIFIVVAGGASIVSMLKAYKPFGNATDAPVSTPIRVLSRAQALPEDTPHAHALVRLGDGCLIELDEYPQSTATRHVPESGLPVGMAVVRFAVRGPFDCALRAGAGGELILGTGANDAAQA